MRTLRDYPIKNRIEFVHPSMLAFYPAEFHKRSIYGVRGERRETRTERKCNYAPPRLSSLVSSLYPMDDPLISV
jgi:hypothetical protein